MSSYQNRVYRADGTYWVDEFRDEVARTVTTYDEAGATLSVRPYTALENATADDPADVAGRTATANADSLRTKANAALTTNATYLGIGAPTNAQNLAQIRALTRQVQALIRLEVRALDTTTGT